MNGPNLSVPIVYLGVVSCIPLIGHSEIKLINRRIIGEVPDAHSCDKGIRCFIRYMEMSSKEVARAGD